MHLHRARAIVYLMGERERLMEKLGVLNISPVWEAVYQEHCAEPEVMTVSALAEKHQLSEEEVSKIITNMSEHTWRKKNLNDSNSYFDWCLDAMESLGTHRQPHTESVLTHLYDMVSQDWTQNSKKLGSRKSLGTISSSPIMNLVCLGTKNMKKLCSVYGIDSSEKPKRRRRWRSLCSSPHLNPKSATVAM